MRRLGNMVSGERYVKIIRLAKKQTLGLIAETSGGKWIGFTFFRGKFKTVDDLRKGRLLWGR